MNCSVNTCTSPGATICKMCNIENWFCMEHALTHFSDHKQKSDQLKQKRLISSEIDKEKILIVQTYHDLIKAIKENMRANLDEFSRKNENAESLDQIKKPLIDQKVFKSITKKLEKLVVLKDEVKDLNLSKEKDTKEVIEEKKVEVEPVVLEKYKKCLSIFLLEHERNIDPVGCLLDKENSIHFVSQNFIQIKYPENVNLITRTKDGNFYFLCKINLDCKDYSGTFNKVAVIRQ